jgi:aldose 1-epimerase
VKSVPFGTTRDGFPAHLYQLENANGFRAEITDFGGTLVRLLAPDRNGRLADVVLGFDSVERYETDSPYFGGIIGRFGNRIAQGKFTLDGEVLSLACNNTPGGRPCHLHGGVVGFDKVRWRAEPHISAAGPALRLYYRSRDDEESYPGNLDVTVTYTVTADNALRIDYQATTDRPTPVNLTNHSYFNLRGENGGDILGHRLTVNASTYTPVDAGLIPTGDIAPVAGTPFDFVAPHPIGERIAAANEQLRHAGGYDHNFVIDRKAEGLEWAATVLEPETGRRLDVLTTEPGIQFYSGNFLDGTLAGKNGRIYPHRGGLCLETQHFPDAPNQPHFASVILRPGDELRSSTVYRFSVV